jgi:hypothetical protein
VRLDELVVTEGQQAEAVLDTEVLENHAFDALGREGRPGALKVTIYYFRKTFFI